MRKKIIGISGVLAVIFLSVIFSWNYRRINRMYPNPQLSKAKIGETVELDGYEFTFTDFQLLDGEKIKEIAGNQEEILEIPNDQYRVMLASVHIKRIAEGEGNIDMTAVAGECGAWKNGIDSELYHTLNPEKSIIQLGFIENQEENIIIPISMNENQFKKGDWEQIDKKTFSIVLGVYPQKVILEGRCE